MYRSGTFYILRNCIPYIYPFNHSYVSRGSSFNWSYRTSKFLPDMNMLLSSANRIEKQWLETLMYNSNALLWTTRYIIRKHPFCIIMNEHLPWRCHQMETFSALLALCAGNSPVPGEFLTQRPVTRSFDVFFDQRLNKQLGKQSLGWLFKSPSRSLWRHCNARDDISVRGVSGKANAHNSCAVHEICFFTSLRTRVYL